MVRKKEFRLKGFISPEEINLSRQKQNYRLYLFDTRQTCNIKLYLLLMTKVVSFVVCSFTFECSIANSIGPVKQNYLW